MDLAICQMKIYFLKTYFLGRNPNSLLSSPLARKDEGGGAKISLHPHPSPLPSRGFIVIWSGQKIETSPSTAYNLAKRKTGG